MDAEAPPVIASTRKANSLGCMAPLLILVAILAVGFLWKLVAPGDSHSRSVDRGSYGTMWPLTVDSAKIGCANGADPYAQVGSIRYGLTGAEYGYSNIASIWADEPATPGLKVDLAALRTDALKLC